MTEEIGGIGELIRVPRVEKVPRIPERRRRNQPETEPRNETKGKTPKDPSSVKPVIYGPTGRLEKVREDVVK